MCVQGCVFSSKFIWRDKEKTAHGNDGGLSGGVGEMLWRFSRIQVGDADSEGESKDVS